MKKIVLTSLVLFCTLIFAQDTPTSLYLATPDCDTGMWVWRRETVVDPTLRQEMLKFSERHGIKRLLVQVRFTGDPGKRVLADSEEMHSLIVEARARGIVIEALDGDKDMGMAERREETLEKLDAILEFNASLPESQKLAGVHYDIEPYLGDRWKSGDEQGVILENLQTMALIREKITPETNLLLAYDIPSFYDRHPTTLNVEFNGEYKNFHQHIQDLSDYIGIMSYRRTATGPNSILDICQAEFEYAEKIGKPVYPAIETIRLKNEPQITFYGLPKEKFLKVFREVQNEGSRYPAFKGIFIHHYEGLRAILNADNN